MIRKLFLAAALSASLLAGGCSNVQQSWDILTSAQVPPKEILIAAQGVNAVEATATNYLNLRRCTGSNGPICRDPVVTVQIIPAVQSLREARNNAVLFLKTHPGQLGPSGLIDAINTAADTLNAIYAKYNIKP